MCDSLCFFLMKRRPPRPTRTDTLFPDTTPFRSAKARLYNLAADPTEQHDLSAQQPQRVAQLSAMIEAQNRDMAKPIWPGLVEGPIRIDVPMNAPWQGGQDYIYWTN